MRILVTGCAGFIGFHVAKALIERGDSVVGFDCVNEYYDARLKESRLAALQQIAEKAGRPLIFLREDLADRRALEACFAAHRFDRVIHLAAQAGVRYAAENPHAYVHSNIVGFTHVLEACRHHEIAHLTYASSSSVYGANTHMPYSELDSASHPIQFYAATKRSNELMAHSYSHLFNLPTTGLRFFTVYGPWGRPDMALFTFTRKILAGEPIELFNHGNHTRDFTFIDDIVDGVLKAADDIASSDPAWNSAAPDPATSSAPFRIFNIGNGRPVKVLDYVGALERHLGRKAIRVLKEAQPGDMADTFANVSAMERKLSYKPSTSVDEGVAAFVDWYRWYYKV